MAERTSRKAEFFKHLFLCFILFFAFFPLYVMIVVSFKTNDQFTNNPWFFDSISTWNWQNWAKGWNTVSTYIANSIVVSVSAVIICLIMGILSSYVLARYRFPGRSILYYGIVSSMFLPGTAATLVTLFTLLKSLSLINSLLALIIVGAVGGQIVCIFILKQFIEDIPKELFESAEIDGAGHLQSIFHIVLPLSGPIVGTLAIMQFLRNWNNLMLPLIVIRDDYLLTVPIGLMRLDGEYVKEWGELMAGYTIASIPLVLLFIFTMKLFIRGLTAGAVKG